MSEELYRLVYNDCMVFFEEDPQEKALRRINACIHTIVSVIEELDDPKEIDERADLLIAVENLMDVSTFLTDQVRGIAWQHSLTPSEAADREDPDSY